MDKDLLSNSTFSKLAIKNSALTSLIDSSQFGAIAKLQNTTFKMNESLFANTSLTRAVKEYSALSSMLKSSHFDHIAKFQSSSFTKLAMKNSSLTSLIDSSQFGAIAKLQNTAFKMNESLFANTSLARAAMKNTTVASIFTDSDLLQKILISIDEQPTAVINVDYIPTIHELNSATELLYSDTDKNSFLDNFSKLPALLQMLIMYMIMSFAIPITNNIAANLLTPIVQSYIDDFMRSDTDKIRDIQKAPIQILSTKIHTDNLRFITGNNVNVRSDPSKKSDRLDQLMLGKIVEVVSKEKNWIEISYKQDENIIQGWVFTRYTKKFKH